ncbi:Uncharacterized protein Fot_05385 [Forsythia ovata]|uniref:Uncharacterized protein n=1 Tax=Forsythia ovata TaxID=205694 RepID=A0ABD1WQA6_9LAMI
MGLIELRRIDASRENTSTMSKNPNVMYLPNAITFFPTKFVFNFKLHYTFLGLDPRRNLQRLGPMGLGVQHKVSQLRQTKFWTPKTLAPRTLDEVNRGLYLNWLSSFSYPTVHFCAQRTVLKVIAP